MYGKGNRSWITCPGGTSFRSDLNRKLPCATNCRAGYEVSHSYRGARRRTDHEQHLAEFNNREETSLNPSTTGICVTDGAE